MRMSYIFHFNRIPRLKEINFSFTQAHKGRKGSR